MDTRLPRAWRLSERDYPENSDSEDQLRFLVGYAILAPSPQNSQPWIFRLDDETIDIVPDPFRILEARDPAGRERAISCGSALFNLRLACRHFGREASFRIHPPEADSEVLARLHREGPCEPAPERQLFQAILQRRSWRQPFAEKPVPADLLKTLEEAARLEGARLTPVTSPSLQNALAGLVAEADWRLGSNEAVRRESAGWIRATDHAEDGVPGRAMGMSPVEAMLAPVTHRVFNYGDTRANRDRSLACTAPLVFALSTEGDEPEDWVACGQAAQRVLLGAVAQGLQGSFLNPPVQIPELRNRLKTLLDIEIWPQVLVRLGYPTGPARPTPRRPLADVLHS